MRGGFYGGAGASAGATSDRDDPPRVREAGQRGQASSRDMGIPPRGPPCESLAPRPASTTSPRTKLAQTGSQCEENGGWVAAGLATLAISLEQAAGRGADVIDLDTAHLQHVQAEYLHAWAEAHRA